MILSKKLRAVLLLAMVFLVVFLGAFLGILSTQSSNSTPSSQAVVINEGMDFSLGPPPNAPNIPLTPQSRLKL